MFSIARWRTWLAARFPRKSLGQRGEDRAARYLRRLGYRLLDRHVDVRVGELDIIAVDGRTIVFVEVKTRASSDAGMPADAVDQRKQQRMTRAALAYLKSHGLLEYHSRFDVVAVTWPPGARSPAIEHFQDAFSAVGKGQFHC
jgi:putative endonuclease